MLLHDTVPVAEWLPLERGFETEFESKDEKMLMEAALIGHHNGVARTMAQEPENYRWVLELDEFSGDV